jgi:ribosomal protein S1
MPRPSSSSRSDDPLRREVDSALEGVNLQEIDLDRPGAAKSESRIVKGAVVGQNGADVFVDLGPRMQGVISAAEFEAPPEVGAVFEFTLGKQEDGLWLLSRRAARMAAAWNELAPGVRVQARVTGQNTGGLELKIGPIGAFMPASQAALVREENLSGFIGKTLECEVLEVDLEKKRVLVSRRAVLEAERESERSKSLGSLRQGQILPGTVRRIEAFGAFVDLGGGVEGLLHVSNLSRQRVAHPSEKLQVGQTLQVQVLDIQEGGRRIALSTKHLEADPWEGAEGRFPAGTVVTGKVTRVADFGAFVELEPGLDGLLHVSQFGRERVRRAQDAAKVGESVTVRVLSIDPKTRKISLSKLDERGAVLGSDEAVDSAQLETFLQQNAPVQGGTNLGALFKKALQKPPPK